MEQESTSEKFEKEIEEIDKLDDKKISVQEPRNVQYNKKISDLKKHNKYNKNEKYQIFGDKDNNGQKESISPKYVEHSVGSLGAVSELARKKLSEAINKKVESVISISKKEDGWAAEIEVIDEEYLPDIELKSMSDIIGIYEIQLDGKGELISWNKKSSRKRGDIN